MFMDGFYRALMKATYHENKKVLVHQDMVSFLIPDATFHASGAHGLVIEMIILTPYWQSSILEALIHKMFGV